MDLYVDEHTETPRIPVKPVRSVSWAPYFLVGLALGLLTCSLVVTTLFLVDYAFLGGGWYALGVTLATLYLGAAGGGVGMYFWRRQ